MDGKDIDTEQFKKVCKSQRCMCIAMYTIDNVC